MGKDFGEGNGFTSPVNLLKDIRIDRLPVGVITATTLVVIVISIYCLSSGWFIIFQNLLSVKNRWAEESLRESAQKFRTFFEHSSSALAIIRKDTTISMVNK
jgi:hypothetical protein